MSDDEETRKAPEASQEATRDFQPSSAPEDAPQTLGRFQLREKVGQGAFGAVYRAFDPVLERDVALKAPRQAGNEEHWAEQFLREAKAAARLHHPHIVAIFDCGLDGDSPFIAMEFVDGQPLAQRLAVGCPDFRQAARWVRDLAFALHYAHSQGIVHRDVKPANIMIDRYNRVRVMDFGLSRQAPSLVVPAGGAAETERTRQGSLVGTPAYMAPEQARGESRSVGPASDQFSLGTVLYEMLTGRRPFESESLAELLAQIADPDLSPPRPREHDPEIPLELEAIALKALQKDAGQRYATAGDLAVDLDRWLSGIAVEAPLQIAGRVIKHCLACGRQNPIRPRCMYCGADLGGVAAQDWLRQTKPQPPPARPARAPTATVDVEDLRDLDPAVRLKLLASAKNADEGEFGATGRPRRLPTRPYRLLSLAIVFVIGGLLFAAFSDIVLLRHRRGETPSAATQVVEASWENAAGETAPPLIFRFPSFDQFGVYGKGAVAAITVILSFWLFKRWHTD